MDQKAILRIQLPGQEMVELPLDVTWDHFNSVEGSNNSGLNAITLTEALWKHCTTFQVVRHDPAQKKIAELEAKAKELEEKLQDTAPEHTQESFLVRVTCSKTGRHADIVKRNGLFHWVGSIRGTPIKLEGDFSDEDCDPVITHARDWLNTPLLLKESLGVLVKRDQVRHFRLDVYWCNTTGLFTGTATNKKTRETFEFPVKFKDFRDSWREINRYVQGKG
ncbi:hypothetical protein AVU25_gp86 [Pseudomonas phage DL64]|uniref:Uncharacterized protein n=1 Tax=Pseudomonas phage DL64 TaxID=1640973 RepID=A0A0F6YPS9_9CAUD|nr:hypothetical protein AVU25_gp86 [Pseudomonas phage DL64]AKF14056.1 hypothetical protein [Pseudomonas phage DL64]